MWLMRIWGVRCSIYNDKSEMAMANDLASRKGMVIHMTNEFYIAGDSKCLESTHHNKQKKIKKKELGEQGENQINVCKFLDGSP